MHISDLRLRDAAPAALDHAASRDTDEPTAPASRIAWITLALLVLLAALA